MPRLSAFVFVAVCLSASNAGWKQQMQQFGDTKNYIIYYSFSNAQ